MQLSYLPTNNNQQNGYSISAYQPKFGSVLVDPNSATPYSDALKIMGAKKEAIASGGYIKRPMNAFMVWSQLERQTIQNEHLASTPSCNRQIHNAEISCRLGKDWNNLTEEQQRPYVEEAERLRLLHIKQFPSYKYKPRKRTLATQNSSENEIHAESMKTAEGNANISGNLIKTTTSLSKQCNSSKKSIYSKKQILKSIEKQPNKRSSQIFPQKVVTNLLRCSSSENVKIQKAAINCARPKFKMTINSDKDLNEESLEQNKGTKIFSAVLSSNRLMTQMKFSEINENKMSTIMEVLNRSISCPETSPTFDHEFSFQGSFLTTHQTETNLQSDTLNKNQFSTEINTHLDINNNFKVSNLNLNFQSDSPSYQMISPALPDMSPSKPDSAKTFSFNDDLNTDINDNTSSQPETFEFSYAGKNSWDYEIRTSFADNYVDFRNIDNFENRNLLEMNQTLQMPQLSNTKYTPYPQINNHKTLLQFGNTCPVEDLDTIEFSDNWKRELSQLDMTSMMMDVQNDNLCDFFEESVSNLELSYDNEASTYDVTQFCDETSNNVIQQVPFEVLYDCNNPTNQITNEYNYLYDDVNCFVDKLLEENSFLTSTFQGVLCA